MAARCNVGICRQPYNALDVFRPRAGALRLCAGGVSSVAYRAGMSTIAAMGADSLIAWRRYNKWGDVSPQCELVDKAPIVWHGWSMEPIYV